MILSDQDIKKALKKGKVIIEPFTEKLLQPASVDLRLGNKFLLFKRSDHYVIDVKKPVDNLMTEHIISNKKPFVLHPGEFALGSIYEKIGVDKTMVGRLEGKSSLGRLGLIVHATAGFLDPGNCLNMTLELHNVGVLPVVLYYKMPIAQMAFEPLSSPCKNPYGSKKNNKYYGATTVQASKMWKNFKK